MESDFVIDVKIGKGQVLVLTYNGFVYGWGINNNGQVGVLNPENLNDDLSSKGGHG